jgi:hypothetical protein
VSSLVTRCITTSPVDRALILPEKESRKTDKWEQDEADTPTVSSQHSIMTIVRACTNLNTGAALSAHHRRMRSGLPPAARMRRQHLLSAQHCVVTCNSCGIGMVLTWRLRYDRHASLRSAHWQVLRHADSDHWTTHQNNNNASFMITCNRLTPGVRRQKQCPQ